MRSQLWSADMQFLDASKDDPWARFETEDVQIRTLFVYQLGHGPDAHPAKDLPLRLRGGKLIAARKKDRS